MQCEACRVESDPLELLPLSRPGEAFTLIVTADRVGRPGFPGMYICPACYAHINIAITQAMEEARKDGARMREEAKGEEE